jgi:hypothetical protein
MLGNSESLRALLHGPITDLLVKLNGERGEEVLRELNKFNRREPCWVKAEEEEHGGGAACRLISGGHFLALSQLKGNYRTREGVESVLKNGGLAIFYTGWDATQTNEALPVSVHEVIKRTTLRRTFTGLSNDANKLLVSRDRVRQFVQEYPQWIPGTTRDDGGILFLIKKDWQLPAVVANLQCAFVYFNVDSFTVVVHDFDSPVTWPGDRGIRVVVPTIN